ncbi:MAG: hypothetical protein JW819_01230 [Candidatus Krumholzibacteriota bacterium]|nr:hypothetical protein [Candidatus Krumholzibacteriota bacterium]
MIEREVTPSAQQQTHSLLAILVLTLALPAFAQMPAVGFDIENAMGHNQYFWNFYVNQVLGFSFIVGAEDVTVTHLGLFDMNPDNEPTGIRRIPPTRTTGSPRSIPSPTSTSTT